MITVIDDWYHQRFDGYSWGRKLRRKINIFEVIRAWLGLWWFRKCLYLIKESRVEIILLDIINPNDDYY